jgi:prefoldin subunit 4
MLTTTSHSYKVGETFVHIPLSRAAKRLVRDIETLDERMLGLTGRAEECEKGMKELKVILYAKFGKAINLDE